MNNISEETIEEEMNSYKFISQTIKEKIEKVATSVTATQKLIDEYPLLKALYRIDGDKVNINYVIFSNDEFKNIAEEINLIFFLNNPIDILQVSIKNSYAKYKETKVEIKNEKENEEIDISYDYQDELLNELRKELYQREEEYNRRKKINLKQEDILTGKEKLI